MASVLGPEWHISATGGDVITEKGSINDKQKILHNALNVDIKEICSGVLSSELSKNQTSKIVLQIQKVRNISAPKANEDSQAAPRMLKLSLSDGETYIQAVELSAIPSISRNNTPPGTKIIVNCAKICSGYLLLSPSNCTVLGGKVPALIEKWELAKSVQRTNQRGLNDDGPPPWVNFGKRIQSGNQEANFKSLENKVKETSKDDADFEAQRQGAIAEATSGAVKKVFGGMVKQNVQPSQNRVPDRPREKKESSRYKNKLEKEDVLEAPLKPEKVSLFSFLEDKLPGCENNDISSREEDNFTRRKMKIPKEFQKPKYDDLYGDFPKVQKTSNSQVMQFDNIPNIQQTPMENFGFFKNHNQSVPQDDFNSRVNSGSEKYQQKTLNSNFRNHSDKQQKKPYDNRGYKSYSYQNETSHVQKPHENRRYDNNTKQNALDVKKSYENRGYINRTNHNNSDTQKPNENRGYNKHTNQDNTDSHKPCGNAGYNNSTNKNNSYTQKIHENRGYNNHASQNDTTNVQKPSDIRGHSDYYRQNKATDSQKLDTTMNRTQSKYNDNRNTHLKEGKYQNLYDSGKPKESEMQGSSGKKQKISSIPNLMNNQDQINSHAIEGNMDDLTQEMEKVNVNSQFASRSLRQHLNLGGQKKNEENLKKNEDNSKKNENIKNTEENNDLSWNIGDDCLAKYWEDGKFYEATIMAITERTVAVKFRDYGNIEEVLTNDCLPRYHSDIHIRNQGEKNRRYDKNGRTHTGSVQFRRTPKTSNNNG